METSNTQCLHGVGYVGEALLSVDPQEVAWDGSLPETTHKVRLANASHVMGHDVFAHLQVVVTGRKVREQRVTAGRGSSYLSLGVKCRFRFTGPDSSGEWFDGVVAG